MTLDFRDDLSLGKVPGEWLGKVPDKWPGSGVLIQASFQEVSCR
jgi:hypothetical protein